MSDGTDGRWRRVAARLAPDGRLLRSRDLPGGLSSEMTVLDIGHDDGAIERVIVRRPRRPDGSSLPIPHEYRLLVALHASGRAVPQPRVLDDSGTILRSAHHWFVDQALVELGEIPA